MKTKQRLIYLPLGGANEIGMNMYLYGYGVPGAENFILVDVGVAFPDMNTSPGVDLIMPDISFIEENKDRLLGIFITHAHEDHIGALGHLIANLNAPIFCRKFSAQIAFSKLDKVGNSGSDIRIVDTYPKKIKLGPFQISFAPISHSIPESSILVIDNPVGRIIHTGDFKIDKTPVLGDWFDQNLLMEINKKEVLAIVCDSTNVFSEGPGRSESSLVTDITNLIKSKKGAVVATTFASNVARLLTLAKSAQSAGRSVLVVGRAMQTMISAASSVGLLTDFPTTLSMEDALCLPRSNLFVLATGSQGEGRAASAQLAREKFMDLVLQEGDTFLFSSKTIPGNELAVSKVVNNLMKRGIDVIDDQNGKYHVSGHANKPDLIYLHELFSPALIVPMHGEPRHLREHQKVAKAQRFNSVTVYNGSILEIRSNGSAQIVDEVPAGQVYYDGGKLIKAGDGIVKTRLQMATRGHLSVSILLEKNTIMDNGIWVKSKGLPRNKEDKFEVEGILEEALEMELLNVEGTDFYDDDLIESLIKRVCSRMCQKLIKKKPVITIFINRVK